MALARWQRSIVDGLGNIQAGASIAVRDRNVGNALATIYSDRAGTTPISNPFTADSNGFAAFYAPGSAYQITATLGAFTIIWDYVGIGNAQEVDLTDILVGVDPQGEWVTAHLYSNLDVVTHNGSSFLCILGHTSGSTTEPGVGASWATNWEFLAKRGDDNPKWLFDTSTTSADPGTGKFRFNNATPASVTLLYVSELSNEFGNPSLATWLSKWVLSRNTTNRAYVTFRSVLNPAKFHIFGVGVIGTPKVGDVFVDNGAWDTILITYAQGNGGAFLASEEVSFSFSRNGDPGYDYCQQTYDASSTTTNADPGNGLWRANNATVASITQFAFDDLTLDGLDVSAFFNSLANSSSNIKGYLTITRSDSGTQAAIFAINSITDQSGYTQVNVTYVSGILPTDGAVTNIAFSRSGDRGTPAGLRYQYDTTTTMADPGTAKYRFNNAAPASATQLAVSALISETGNPDASDWVTTWDDSNSSAKGFIYVRDILNPEKFAIYQIGTVTDNSTWLQIPLTYIAGNAGSFSNNSIFAIDFIRTGDVGQLGFTFAYSTTTTMADPGVGAIRFNNATLASVTAIAIDDQTSLPGNADVSASILTWDDSTSGVKGTLTLSKVGDPSTYIQFQITSLVDNSGWTQLNVTYIGTAGTFTNGMGLAAVFDRTGDVGTPTIDIPVVLGDGISVVPTGYQGFVLGPFDFSCNLTGWSALAKQSGSISIDVEKCTYAQYDAGSTHPVTGDKISASAPIAISSATKNQGSVSTWTVAVAVGDILHFRPTSVTTITQVALFLKATKTS